DVHWSLIIDISIHTLTWNVPTKILTGGGMLEHVDDITIEHAHLFEIVAIRSSD
ncbi:hypothetical protein KI387_036114, partial [Taxus chinensis]